VAGNGFSSAQLQMSRLQAMQNAAGSLLASMGMFSVLALGIPLVSAGKIEGVFLPVIVLAALSSYEGVLPLPLAAQHLEKHIQAARRLFEIVDAEPEVSMPEAPAPLPEGLGVEVRNLRFRYSPSPRPAPTPGSPYALDGISFKLPPAHRLAIVGPSGAGKSTLINLLLRFWDFHEGEIRLGGNDLRRYDPYLVRRSMGVVSQNAFLFTATVRDNLLIAQPNASQAELIQAARAAQIDDFLSSLPQGYDTWIGEGGFRLSGGQRQRLAIARALLKGAPLLILDEATANLDPITEREVLSTLYAAMEGRTVLAITHRLVGLEAMDEILVLRQGKIVERGTHAELLKLGGLYRRMWDLQNRIL
jgi:ABC-type multidrug transport system fused ATPase/permease subunit